LGTVALCPARVIHKSLVWRVTIIGAAVGGAALATEPALTPSAIAILVGMGPPQLDKDWFVNYDAICAEVHSLRDLEQSQEAAKEKHNEAKQELANATKARERNDAMIKEQKDRIELVGSHWFFGSTALQPRTRPPSCRAHTMPSPRQSICPPLGLPRAQRDEREDDAHLIWSDIPPARAFRVAELWFRGGTQGKIDRAKAKLEAAEADSEPLVAAEKALADGKVAELGAEVKRLLALSEHKAKLEAESKEMREAAIKENPSEAMLKLKEEVSTLTDVVTDTSAGAEGLKALSLLYRCARATHPSPPHLSHRPVAKPCRIYSNPTVALPSVPHTRASTRP
jgi:hypothetical protein